MNFKSITFDWGLISKWRTHLMGIGILGVMIGHLMEWANVGSIIYYCLIPFVGLVFTEGFLLLSGFGLFCSLCKNRSTLPFYKKRIDRLLFPYWIMVIPLCLLTLFNGESFSIVTLEIFTLKYWIVGNTAMWYISVSLLLYLLCPLLFDCCFNNGCTVRGFLIVLFLFYLIGVLIWALFADYYKVTYLGYTQMPMFIVGMGLGYLYTHKKHLKNEIVIMILVAIAGVLLSFTDGIFAQYANGFKRMTGVICSCIALEWLAKRASYSFDFLAWFGKLSLELYILHIMLHRLLAPVGGGNLCNNKCLCGNFISSFSK